MKDISWDDYRIAYQVALDGSLSQAGKSLGINHATVLRRINQLEMALELKLFIRHQRGYKLTDAGSVLMDEFPELIARFSRLENCLHNVEGHLSGELRITTLTAYSMQLTPIFKDFREVYPDIRIKLLSTDAVVALESGAAHVSLRTGHKPDGPDLIVKRLMPLATAYYAAPSYVAQFGLPKSLKQLNQHYWALLSPEKYHVAFIRKIVGHLDKDRIVFQSNHFPDICQAVVAGMGIGPIDVQQAKMFPSLVPVPLELPKTDEAMWFVYHKDLKHSARIKCLYEFFSHELSNT
jgi:DNA-binding transcriptional LysR family regulator